MENIKKKLKLFQDLKDSSLPNPEDSLEELIKKKDIYDINPNTNYALRLQYIKLFHKDLVKNFYLYNQTLTFAQRQDIIKKLENTNAGKLITNEIVLSKESYIEKYFNILNELKNCYTNQSFDNYRKIKHLFETKYYANNKQIKIPLIYGTTELKYSGLINNLYQCLFFDGLNEKEIFINFRDNITYIADYLNKICDDEFFEVFNVKNQYHLDEIKKFVQEYQLNPELDSLYFHLLFFDLLLSLYIHHGDITHEAALKNIFFEKKQKKIKY